MKTAKLYAVAFFTVLFTLLTVPIIDGCGHLDPAGVYQGDKLLYDADLLLPGAYITIHQFVTWEAENRGRPNCPKEATAAADQLRAKSRKAFADAWSARAAYVAVKNDTTTGNFTKALSVIRTLLTIAADWTPQVQLESPTH